MSSGGEITTILARTSEDPDTQARATAYLERSGNADLLPMLGLDGWQTPTVDGRGVCPACGHPLPADSRKACRRDSCDAGPKARGAKR